mmetsp:Transcript_13054/g.31028  ORF Transcript_13054/g.31028 Transcript_13054/m.31028 type:complete len:286 (+) Transcript_13054:2110-2967(+)
MRAMAQPPRSATTMPPESTNMQGSCSTQPSTTTVCPCRYIAEVTRAFKASRKPVPQARKSSTWRTLLPEMRPPCGEVFSFSKCSVSTGCFLRALCREGLAIARTSAKGVKTRTVAFASLAMPISVRSPKQFPAGTSFTVPSPAIWMLTRPCSSTKRVPAVPPCCTTVSPAKSRRRSPLLATSLTKPRSQPKNKFSELATSVFVNKRSLMHSATSTRRSVAGCSNAGYTASTFRMTRPGITTASTSVFARTEAGRGTKAPIKLMSPMMAPARRRPTVCCSAVPSTS